MLLPPYCGKCRFRLLPKTNHVLWLLKLCRIILVGHKLFLVGCLLDAVVVAIVFVLLLLHDIVVTVITVAVFIVVVVANVYFVSDGIVACICLFLPCCTHVYIYIYVM